MDLCAMDIVPKTHKPEYYAEHYPGFPDFIHDIMAYIAQGKTPEEAAKLADSEQVRRNVDNAIKYIESKLSTRETPMRSEITSIEEVDEHGEPMDQQ